MRVCLHDSHGKSWHHVVNCGGQLTKQKSAYAAAAATVHVVEVLSHTAASRWWCWWSDSAVEA